MLLMLFLLLLPLCLLLLLMALMLRLLLVLLLCLLFVFIVIAVVFAVVIDGVDDVFIVIAVVFAVAVDGVVDLALGALQRKIDEGGWSMNLARQLLMLLLSMLPFNREVAMLVRKNLFAAVVSVVDLTSLL